MKIKGTVIGCLLSFFFTLYGCSNFDVLNGGIQVEPWPDDLEIQLSQNGGQLCYEIENESWCFKKRQSSYLDAYHEIDKYNTFARFKCRRMENVRNVCHVYKQMGGPKGGSVLRDKNREWKLHGCYILEPSGWGVEECDISSIHGENLKSKIAYYQEEENRLNREALEENRKIYNYRLKQIRENPKVGDRVSIGFFKSGIIVEVKRPLVLVQLNSPENGVGTKWVEIQNLNPL